MSSVKFSVNVRAREFADQVLIKHELIKRLHARLGHEGVVHPAADAATTDGDRLAGRIGF